MQNTSKLYKCTTVKKDITITDDHITRETNTRLTIIAEVVDEDDFMDEVLRAPVQHAETKSRNTHV